MVLLFYKNVILMVGNPTKQTIQNRFHFRPFDLALTSILATVNFILSVTLAPALKLVVPHAFLGAFIMVPLDLFVSYICWEVTHKNIFCLYFFIYGLLTIPTTIWGSTPGIFKPILGIAIGLALDGLTLRLNPQTKITRLMFAVIFPIIYWSLTATVWTIAGLPIVQIFQKMMMSAPILNSIIPSGFVSTFTVLTLLTIPSSIVAVNIAVSTSKRVKKIVPIAVRQVNQ
jgi:hypothetical protein